MISRFRQRGDAAVKTLRNINGRDEYYAFKRRDNYNAGYILLTRLNRYGRSCY